MSNYYQPLLPGEKYHLFSRAVGSEKLFLSHENYLFFLKKLKQHTASVCNVYCYALLPNHFHLLVKINEETAIKNHFLAVKNRAYNPLQNDLPDFIMERFSNFLNSYTKSFNKVNMRKGALFMDYLKRSAVNEDKDFTSFVWYIHKNAVHHGLTKNIGQWKYDSYSPLLSESPTSLLRNELMGWFGGKEEFVAFHQQPVYSKINQDLVIPDL